MKPRIRKIDNTRISPSYAETLVAIQTGFWCQRDIEDKSKCTKQCDHCKEYYRPLEAHKIV